MLIVASMTALAWNDHELHLGPTARGAPADVVPWALVERIVAVDPWPAVRLTWYGASGRATRELRPPHDEDDRIFARLVDNLFADAARYAPAEAVLPGWTAWPDTAWERAGHFPTDHDAHGAYRTSARDEADPVVAYRELVSVLDFLFRWVAPAPWSVQAREVAVTARHVWVRRRDGTVWSVPRETLRDVRRFPDGQVCVTFGRRTQLWLHDRPGCPVLAALRSH
jgi:hypothetical protein